jgi:hypothetical protein
MTAEQWPAIIIAAGGFLAIVGTGLKWMLSQFEKRLLASEEAARMARVALDTRLSGEIEQLRMQINVLEAQKSLFLRRIYQLENFIHRMPGLEIPDMKGWPPE